MPLRALVWSIGATLVLALWPWLLAWLRARRPQILAGTATLALADLGAMLRAGGRLRGGTLLAWTALATAAAILPAGNGWAAAELDAGLLWLVALAATALAGLCLSDSRPAAPAAAGLLTLVLCLAPVVMHTASLHLGDLAIAQQGGAGNWFIVRDPCLFLAGGVYLLAVAALWPAPPPAAAGGPDGLLAASLRAGVPLVAAHLFTVAFLGGWWAFLPALDGLSWLHTALKNLSVVALLLWLRRRPALCAARHLTWRLPLAASAACLGAVLWLTLSGAVL